QLAGSRACHAAIVPDNLAVVPPLDRAGRTRCGLHDEIHGTAKRRSGGLRRSDDDRRHLRRPPAKDECRIAILRNNRSIAIATELSRPGVAAARVRRPARLQIDAAAFPIAQLAWV